VCSERELEKRLRRRTQLHGSGTKHTTYLRAKRVGSEATNLKKENTPLAPETWLSTKETAWVCGRTERTIRYWVQYKSIPCARGAGDSTRHKFRAKDLLEWLRCGKMVKDATGATERLVSLMAVGEVPSQLLVAYVVKLQKGFR
jgi:hypothetical protein